MEIGNGSETSRQLNCQKCGDYLYYVGNIACIANGNIICTEKQYDKIIQNNKLKPEIKQRIPLKDEFNKISKLDKKAPISGNVGWLLMIRKHLKTGDPLMVENATTYIEDKIWQSIEEYYHKT